MGEFVSRKSDATSKIPTQSLPAGVWTLLEVEGQKVITPKSSSSFGAIWAIYLNLTNPALGGATELSFRWVREPHQVNPKGVHDYTGQRSWTIKPGANIGSWTWAFQAIKGQMVGVEIKHNGKKPLLLTTRETKMMFEVGK
jgi:hypothetical protein